MTDAGKDRNVRNPMDLTGRTIIVTGAGQGIGRAIAGTVVELGGNVVLVERNETTLAEAAQALPAERALAVAGDVSDPAFAPAVVERAADRFGAAHGLVNNAGITRPAMIEKMSLVDWNAVISVNLTGCYLMLQAVGRHMVARAREGDKNPGAIVNISSVAGKRGSVGQINYASAKAGLFGMTMSAAREWGSFGVRVNSVGFGMVETQMTEVVRSPKFRDKYLQGILLARFSTPEEVANPICFLLSEAASYITGQNITVCGGMHLQP